MRFMFRKLIQSVAFGCLAAAVFASAETYDMRGKIVELREKNQTAVIHHEAVEGLMPAMTMPFSVPNDEDFAKLGQGKKVAFEFVMGDKQSYARNFEVVGDFSDEGGREAAGEIDPRRKAESKGAKLERGDEVPGYTLTASNGGKVKLPATDGRATVLTFIFTRCPVPEYCPLLGTKFRKLQTKFKEAGLQDRARLLSITIDPEYDTPEVLADYGESLGADPEVWNFGTGSKKLIDAIAGDFRVYFEEDRENLVNHALCTAYVDADGTVRAIWRGNKWKVATVFQRVRETLPVAE